MVSGAKLLIGPLQFLFSKSVVQIVNVFTQYHLN